MRGLDIRVELAMARVTAVIHREDATLDIDLMFSDALHNAHWLGYSDAEKGYEEPPIMFHDELDLLAWWKDGHATFFRLAADANEACGYVSIDEDYDDLSDEICCFQD